jgi:hypothetical protein
MCFISGFRRDAEDICALLKYYAAMSGSSVPTFRDNLSLISSRVKMSKNTAIFLPLKLGPRGTETSVQNYHSTLRNIQEQRRYQSVLCKKKALKIVIVIGVLLKSEGVKVSSKVAVTDRDGNKTLGPILWEGILLGRANTRSCGRILNFINISTGSHSLRKDIS